MTAHQLARLLLDGDDLEVYLCPNVAPVDAIEQCPGDHFYALDPYITIHSACKYPADHGFTHQDDLDDAMSVVASQRSTEQRIPLQDAIDMVRADHREALDRLADTIPEFSGYCYNHSSYYCGCMKEKTA